MADGRHSTARPPPPRVLLVESETPARKAITTEVLSGLGLRVAEAASAEAALRAAGATPGCPRDEHQFSHRQDGWADRAIGNLVANALAHTPPGGAVRVVARRHGGGVLSRLP